MIRAAALALAVASRSGLNVPYIKGEKVVQIDTTDPFVGATAVKMGAQFLFALMVSEIEERATTSRPSGEWN